MNTASRTLSRLSIAAALLSSQFAWALGAGGTVDNFRLIDDQGKSHELYYLSDMKAVVLMAYGNDCAAATQAAEALQKLHDKYASQGVEFLLLDSNLKDTREAIVAAKQKSGVALPVLIDDLQLIGESLDVSTNGEVLIVDPKNWKLAYRGAHAQVDTALDAMLRGEAVKVAAALPQGCAVAMPERDRRSAHAQISYEKTIAPMLIDRCVMCHRAGGIGPWQMSGYNMIRGFAPMIREVVRTERMPPWHADPHYSVFSNDRSLTKEQAKTLVHWIEAGAPRGDGPDPLTQVKQDWPEWPLGKPDLVVEFPKFDVPSTGVIPYQNWTIDNPLDHDVWVRAVDFLPGSRANLHHLIATIGGEYAQGGGGQRPRPNIDFSKLTQADIQRLMKLANRRRDSDGSLADYVPGAEPLQIPTESGILLKAGAKFGIQAHYTTNGKAATDVTRMGLYFMKVPPKYRYRAAIMANPFIKIPANTKEHTETASYSFDRDVMVYSLHPHSHYRGRSAEFVAQYPDGREEILLNVPRYDFNWQTTYELKTPKVLPAGTKVTYYTVFDNSVQNKANPDPNRVVPWGLQSWDEMVYGVIRFRYLDEDATPAAVSRVDP